MSKPDYGIHHDGEWSIIRALREYEAKIAAEDGTWTMTETEFKFSLARAWDEGQRAWEDELLSKTPGTNPYEAKP